MQKTNNYGFNKPEKTDYYDVAHMNENMDAIDNELRKQIVVSEGSDTLTNSLAAPIIYLKNNGYTSQNGTPTPTAPIEVIGCGVTNLLNITVGASTSKGVTCTPNGDGTYTLNGTATDNADFTLALNHAIIKGNGKLKRNCLILSGSYEGTINHMSYNASWSHNVATPLHESELLKTNVDYVHFGLKIARGTVVNNLKIGAIVAEYTDVFVPYGKYALPIKLSNEDKSESVTASIPIDFPLYEGDYIEIYADGSGEIVRTMAKKVITSSDYKETASSRNGYYYTLNYNYDSKDNYTSRRLKGWSNWFRIITADANAEHTANMMTVGNSGWGGALRVYMAMPSSINTKELMNEFLDNNEVYFIYPLAEPTRTPLTAEQVAEFKKLHTFNGTTHVNADGTTTVRYYCDSDGGDSMRMLQKMIESKNHVKSADTATVALSAMSADHAETSSCADKLSNTKAIGSASKPVYFKDGVPVECDEVFVMNEDGEWDVVALKSNGSVSNMLKTKPTYSKVGNVVYIECLLYNTENGLEDISGFAGLPYPPKQMHEMTDWSNNEKIIKYYTSSMTMRVMGDADVRSAEIEPFNNQYSYVESEPYKIVTSEPLTASDKVAIISGWYIAED